MLARGGDVVIRADGGDVAFNLKSNALGVNDLKLACELGADRKMPFRCRTSPRQSTG
jgi:hypothetical protein